MDFIHAFTITIIKVYMYRKIEPQSLGYICKTIDIDGLDEKLK